MNLKKWFGLSNTTKFILSLIIYLLFFVFMIKLIIEEPKSSVQITYAVILIFFGFFTIYYEILKRIYNNATYALIQKCDPYRGMELIQLLKKYDFFKSYKTSIHIFNLLSMRDLGQPNETINYLEATGKKAFSSSFDLLLIYNFSFFNAYYSLQNLEKANEYYNHVMSLQGKKIGTRKINPLFSWDEITAMHKHLTNHNKESKKHLQMVNTDAMNLREQVHFNMLFAEVDFELKNFRGAKQHLEFVIENGGKIALVDQAKKLLHKC